MKKAELIRVFAEVIQDLERAQGDLIQERPSEDYTHEDLEEEIEGYWTRLIDALK